MQDTTAAGAKVAPSPTKVAVLCDDDWTPKGWVLSHWDNDIPVLRPVKVTK